MDELAAKRVVAVFTSIYGTRYSRFYPERNFSQHLAAIVTNAVMHDAEHTMHQIVALQLATRPSSSSSATGRLTK